MRIGKSISEKVNKSVHKQYAHLTYPILALVFFVVGMFIISDYFDFPWILSYLILINLLSFFFIVIDKIIAMVRDERVPEWVLHTLALMGGVPAMAIAIPLVKHNRDKVTFRIVLWVIAILQALALFIWFDAFKKLW